MTEQTEQSLPPSPAPEAVLARIERLGLTEISAARLESLTLADAAGVSDDLFAEIGGAMRVNRQPSIVLPAHRFESLSRGRGWCRKGKGASAEWGERTDKGYRVGPGRWVVGGDDGFSRKGSDDWRVWHVQVGGQTWTLAE